MHVLILQPPFYWIVIGCWILWGMSEWGQSIFLKKGESRTENKYSTAGIYSSVFLLVLLYNLTLIKPQVLAFNTLALPLFITGLLSFITGFSLRWSSVYIMGDAFSRQIRTTDHQKIIKIGPFAYIRHPNYLAGLLTFIGFGLMFGTWISLAVSIIIGFLPYYYRIRIEEKFLRKNLPGYDRYCQEVKYRLIPFVY
jgi:protein-S-isoprenylcysteine O-methyltransferase Ste14